MTSAERRELVELRRWNRVLEMELEILKSDYWDWRDRPPMARTLADAALTEKVQEIHTSSYGTYGARRVPAELRLRRGVRCGRGGSSG